MTSAPGTLYVVATPIGNLEDLTFRALRILREVDLIAAEDTRRTSKLLARYEIRKPLISVREHNELREADRLIARLTAGENVALVSDAGTPGIADPGARLVRAVRTRGLQVVPIPGPSAVAAAMSVAGLVADEFVFMGFPPPTGSVRTRWFDRLATEARPIVFFEAPHRIRRTLADLTARIGAREIQIFRELTKINESLVILPNGAGYGSDARGEFTLVIGPADESSDRNKLSYSEISNLFYRLTNSGSFNDDDAMRVLACYFKQDARVIAKAIKKARISVKQQNRPPA